MQDLIFQRINIKCLRIFILIVENVLVKDEDYLRLLIKLLSVFNDNSVAKFFDNVLSTKLLRSSRKWRWSLSRYSLRLSLTISRPEGSASQEEQNRRSTGKIEENEMRGERRWGRAAGVEATGTWRRILHDSLCANYQVTPSCQTLLTFSSSLLWKSLYSRIHGSLHSKAKEIKKRKIEECHN